jgi:hypothetical protein
MHSWLLRPSHDVKVCGKKGGKNKVNKKEKWKEK